MLVSTTLSILLAALPPPPPGLWAARRIGCEYDTRHRIDLAAPDAAPVTTAIAPPLVRIYADIDSRAGGARRDDDGPATGVKVVQSVAGLVIEDAADGTLGTTTVVYDTAGTRALESGTFPALRHTHVPVGQVPAPAIEAGRCRVID